MDGVCTSEDDIADFITLYDLRDLASILELFSDNEELIAAARNESLNFDPDDKYWS